MNERAVELYKQAVTFAYNTAGKDAGKGTVIESLTAGKFAELIVRECLACARGAGLADDVAVRNGLGFNDGISEAVTHMKQHFGVEE